MEILETENGIFTNNETTGQTAKEVYQEWLENKTNNNKTLTQEQMLTQLIINQL